MAIDWQKFWNFSYRVKEAETADDLFFQVGKTINKKPIDKAAFDLTVRDIVRLLALAKNDTCFDLCCGNGLVTFELSSYVKKIYGVDFSENLIQTAIKLKSSSNIEYVCADALGFLNDGRKWPESNVKILMNAALAYFQPDDLRRALSSINGLQAYSFLITEVPNALRMSNFYNTPERQQRYRELQQKGDDSNDGLGRWWHPMEINEICKSLELGCNVFDQRPELSNYRMNILIQK